MAIPHRSVVFRSRWVFAVGLASVIVALLLAVGHALSLLARDHVIRALKETYARDLELRRFEVALFPAIRITGEGLVFRYRGRSDVPPLISVERFSANTNWIAVLGKRRIKQLRLEGLRIHVPPRHGEAGADAGRPEDRKISRFVIDEIDADGTLLEILPKKQGKEPLRFDIQRLTLHGAGPNEPMSFRATLINAKPPGQIQSSGKFGPWQAHEPGLTPVSGRYTFQNADLSVFRGIAGILSSEGSYQGVLDHINVEGHTDTPNFSVRVSGHPVHLTTQFQAVVHGTDGNTLLAPVNAQFGNSAVSAWSSVEGEPGVKGKTISLDVTVDAGRVEDMLHLGVRAEEPPMTGAISFRTKLVIPPGNADIAEKLRLDGGFDIGTARFSEFDVQAKVDQLSRRGRGEKGDVDVNSVASNFRGRFVLNRGVMTFTNLAFNVPGVRISLNGTYGLLDERLDFHGTARLDAKLSQTTTGASSRFS